ncbi:putative CDP-diacylglycerol pyrophosphatase [Methylobacterium iners]|uniref:CDP-diacylglycerol pyrophosphatase n=2 Tax=Methylobacterium iners TaxID=418707 RepID=A0ABQ4S8S5_9HYPH|nr:putative CDP-diacylglycerol pyrophosphatase [Methylobacterium iners]
MALLGGVLAAGAAQAVPDPSRNVLWTALQGCILAKQTLGRTFPCLAVDLGDKERPGTAVLRAPGQPTHTVVIPTAHVAGLEAPELQGPNGIAYWRAALAARSYVTDALRGQLSLQDVGMAVNSAGGRSQDQLHIHLDCVDLSTRAALQQFGRNVTEQWSPLPVGLHGSRFFAMRIPAAKADSFNPFVALMHLPGRQTILRATSLAVISTPQEEVNQGFYVLAYRSPGSHAEKLLDHTCAAATGAAVTRPKVVARVQS